MAKKKQAKPATPMYIAVSDYSNCDHKEFKTPEDAVKHADADEGGLLFTVYVKVATYRTESTVKLIKAS